MKGIRKMKKTIKVMLAGMLIVPVLAFSSILVRPVSVSAQVATGDCSTTSGIKNGAACGNVNANATSLFGTGGIFTTITNVALYLIGALSVIMLIYGGIRYTVSMGDSKNVEAAKNTILYAVVGIVVAVLAYAIVNYVLVALLGSS